MTTPPPRYRYPRTVTLTDVARRVLSVGPELVAVPLLTREGLAEIARRHREAGA